MKYQSVFFIIFFCYALQAQASISLTSPSGVSQIRKDYIYDIFVAALKHSNQNSNSDKVTVIPTSAGYSASTYAVQHDQADVTYFPTNIKAEQQLIPIRIPLYKGLMGYRILVIQKEYQARFDKFTSLAQLKAIPQGAGTRWRTTKIFEHHDFNYITADRTSSLLKMLDANRFLYTTRGLIEVPETISALQSVHTNLKIEDSQVIYTELPVYFFVAKHRTDLATKIQDGLNHIVENGEFDKIFDRFFNTIPTSLNLDKRTIHHIENPFLSDETKTNAKSFWRFNLKRPLSFQQ